MTRKEKLDLLSKYLDKRLSDTERVALETMLEEDAEAAELLYELSLQDTLLHRLHAGSAAMRPYRRRQWFKRLAAAALLFLAVLAGLLVLGRTYPVPTVTKGDGYEIRGDERGMRGATVITNETPATVVLGGYCTVDLAPESALVIEGDEKAEEIFLEKGEVRCRVASDIGSFVVRTKLGNVSVQGTEFVVRLVTEPAKGEQEMNVKEMFVKVLAGVVLVTGMYGSPVTLAADDDVTVRALGTIEAGKPVYKRRDHAAWKTKGRIVGRVRNAPVCEIDVLDSRGKIAKSTRLKQGSLAYEIAWLAPGTYTLRVSAKDYKTLTLKGLRVKAKNDLFVNLEFSPAGGDKDDDGKDDDADDEGENDDDDADDDEGENDDDDADDDEGERDDDADDDDENDDADDDEKPAAEGTIEAGKPVYKPKNHKAWARKGRIVGLVSNAPVCEIDVLGAGGKVVKSTRLKNGAKVYEIEWLAPGTYGLRVSAKGYKTLTLEGLRVKAKNDLFLNLEFTARKNDGDADEKPKNDAPKDGPDMF